MRAVNKKILVSVKMNQKSTQTIIGQGGEEIDLQIEKQYDVNGRQRNAVLCTVINNSSEYDYIRPGDNLLVHHNFFDKIEDNSHFIGYDREAKTAIFSIPSGRNIFCKLLPDGTTEPVCNNMLVERLRNPIKAQFIYIPDTVKQEYNDRVKVLSVAPEVQGIEPGQVVLIYQMADYEICYNFEKKEESVVKVWDEEVIGIMSR